MSHIYESHNCVILPMKARNKFGITNLSTKISFYVKLRVNLFQVSFCMALIIKMVIYKIQRKSKESPKNLGSNSDSVSRQKTNTKKKLICITQACDFLRTKSVIRINTINSAFPCKTDKQIGINLI